MDQDPLSALIAEAEDYGYAITLMSNGPYSWLARLTMPLHPSPGGIVNLVHTRAGPTPYAALEQTLNTFQSCESLQPQGSSVISRESPSSAPKINLLKLLNLQPAGEKITRRI